MKWGDKKVPPSGNRVKAYNTPLWILKEHILGQNHMVVVKIQGNIEISIDRFGHGHFLIDNVTDPLIFKDAYY